MGRRYPIDRVSLSGSPHYHETTINLIQKLCEGLDIWFIGSRSDDMSNRLISDVKVNLSRQAERDLLKAYPILFMIIIILGVSLILQLIGRCLAILPEMTSDLGYITGLLLRFSA